jgi:hypothetical protein
VEDSKGCIDDLIGPKARAMGARCPCPAHTQPKSVEEKANEEFSKESQPEPVKRKPHNGKMAAANDK